MPRFALSEDADDTSETPRRRPLFEQATPAAVSSYFPRTPHSTPWTSPPASISQSRSSPLDSSSRISNNNFSASSVPAGKIMSAQKIQSVRLACQAPDCKAWFSVTGQAGNYGISVEFDPTDTEDAENLSFVARIPSGTQDWLRVDSPRGFVCLEGDGFANDTPVRLCLYATKAIFVCTVSPQKRSIIAVQSLLEQPLMDYATRVVRVRAAPQPSWGFSVYNPSGCCAVLLEDVDAAKYQLICLQLTFQGQKNDYESLKVSQRTALAWLINQGEAGAADAVTDFCFLKSNGALSLVTSMTIALLHKSGDVDIAGPVIWDGATAALTAYQNSLDALKVRVDSLDRGKRGPQRRQALAMQRYLVEIFERGSAGAAANARQHFVQVRFDATDASSWTIQLQPALLHATMNTPQSPALSMESVPAGEDFVGLLIGHSVGTAQAVSVDVAYALANPSVLIPSFDLARREDHIAIADEAWKCARVVDYVHLDLTINSNHNSHALALLPDPRSQNLLHVVTPSGVITISSNSLTVAMQQLRAYDDEYADIPPRRVTAYKAVLSSTETDEQAQAAVELRGAVIWHGKQEILSVRWNNDRSSLVHVSQEQYAHELATLFPSGKFSPHAPPTSSTMVRALEQTPPFFETIQPFVTDLNNGLGNMTKFVGGQTSVMDMTATNFSAAVDLFNRMKSEVYTPLMGLREQIKLRKNALAEMIAEQQNGLQSVVEQVAECRKRRASILEILKQKEIKMQQLKQRSDFCLQKLKNPPLTKAELEYCESMEQARIRADQIETKATQLLNKVQGSCRALDELVSSSDNFNVDEELTKEQWSQVEKCNDAMAILLENIRKRLAESDKKLQMLSKDAEAKLASKKG